MVYVWFKVIMLLLYSYTKNPRENKKNWGFFSQKIF